ncbi:MAG TPA: DUF3662 and FHA domain-containing protein [Anaerolineae bacterium]|nr:DUF3662 and FHA domain-containing protein [Anaerolineae bacterium]
MSLLRDLEQRLEALFEGFFSRQFKSGVQPVEIAKRLTRAMDGSRTISVSKVYVPNRYTIIVSTADTEKLRPFEKTLISEFQGFLIAHARKEKYELVSRPKIEFKEDPGLSLGELVIESGLESGSVEPEVAIEGTRVMTPEAILAGTKRAYLIMVGPGGETKYALTTRSFKIGRAPDNDVIIPDPNVSRHHAHIESISARHVLKDLDSTNGTLVNGTRINEHSLKEGDIIIIGTTKFRFRREYGI